MNVKRPSRPFNRKQWLTLLIVVVALYVLLPQLGAFRHSLTVLERATWTYLLLALLFALFSYAVAAGTYYFLAFHRLVYARTVLLQFASTFANRLLPAGIGGIGTYYAYLRASRHTSVQAAGVVAANNTLGFVGHMLLLGGLLIVWRNKLPPLHLWHVRQLYVLIFVVVVLVLGVGLLLAGRFRRRLGTAIGGLLTQLSQYRKRPRALLLALGCSMGLTLCTVLSLWWCVLALHVSLPFISVLIAFTFSLLLATATPTPGGLGGFEAGLIAGMTAYRVDAAAALAVALVYRLINYWLALALGALAFAFGQKRGYL